MSVAGIPVTVKQDFPITKNTAAEICVTPAMNSLKPQCVIKSLDGTGLFAKYSALSYMAVGSILTWLTKYFAQNPNGPAPTPDQQKQVTELVFQQLPFGDLCPLEDNGAAWTYELVTKALTGLIPNFTMTMDEFNANLKPWITKYVTTGVCGGGGGGNVTPANNKWLGMPIWFWVVLVVLLVLGALSMYMKRGGADSDLIE